ncbi:hypothetical protein BC831DRAFT_549856 [Entophlyctis helioformis]|nr:hypothetical protein BC831DRAFT_549856 [Entophlyctis helioformis]
MRDARRTCGLTVHQAVPVPTPLPSTAAATAAATPTKPTATTTTTTTTSDYSQGKATTRIGPQCPEFVYKDGAVERKKPLPSLPPADHRARSYLGVPHPHSPFSIFLWYARRDASDPDVVCVDITVDGKRSPGWVLRSGRMHGIAIEKVLVRGVAASLEFSPAGSGGAGGGTKKDAYAYGRSANGGNGGNGGGRALSASPVVSGTIEAKFWRVMRIEGHSSRPAKRHKKTTATSSSSKGSDGNVDVLSDPLDDPSNNNNDDQDDQDDEDDEDEDDEANVEYVPDEGLPALCVLTLYYRDMAWLTSKGVVRPSKQPLGDSTNTRPSSTPARDASGSAGLASTTPKKQAVRTKKTMVAAAVAAAAAAASSSTSSGPLSGPASEPDHSSQSQPRGQQHQPPDTPVRPAPPQSAASMPPSDLSTLFSSPIVSRDRQMNFSMFASSPMVPPSSASRHHTPQQQLHYNGPSSTLSSLSSVPSSPCGRAFALTPSKPPMPPMPPACAPSSPTPRRSAASAETRELGSSSQTSGSHRLMALDTICADENVDVDLDGELWSAPDLVPPPGVPDTMLPTSSSAASVVSPATASASTTATTTTATTTTTKTETAAAMSTKAFRTRVPIVVRSPQSQMLASGRLTISRSDTPSDLYPTVHSLVDRLLRVDRPSPAGAYDVWVETDSAPEDSWIKWADMPSSSMAGLSRIHVRVPAS